MGVTTYFICNQLEKKEVSPSHATLLHPWTLPCHLEEFANLVTALEIFLLEVFSLPFRRIHQSRDCTDLSPGWKKESLAVTALICHQVEKKEVSPWLHWFVTRLKKRKSRRRPLPCVALEPCIAHASLHLAISKNLPISWLHLRSSCQRYLSDHAVPAVLYFCVRPNRTIFSKIFLP